MPTNTDQFPDLEKSVDDFEALHRRLNRERRLISLDASEVAEQPFLVWNAFVIVVGAVALADMSSVQRPAAVAFRYESEVQNGGHYQFFMNTVDDPPQDVARSLDELGLGEHAELFRAASSAWDRRPPTAPTSEEEFCDGALSGEFDDFDSRYHALSPSVQEGLERYLEKHRPEFVEIVEQSTSSL